MNCQDCGKRGGSTRCEGCQQLFCMTCTIKHHDSRIQQFQTVADLRNQMKETLDALYSNKKTNSALHPAVLKIDQWEKESIAIIRSIANKLKEEVDIMIMTNVQELNAELEQISTTIQDEEKKETYLEPDIKTIHKQLMGLQREIENIQENIEVHTESSDRFEWKSLISVKQKNVPGQIMIRQVREPAATIDLGRKSFAQSFDEIKANIRQEVSLAVKDESIRSDLCSRFARLSTVPRNHSGSTPSNSNEANAEEKTDRIRSCIIHKNHNENVRSSAVCPDCDSQIKRNSQRRLISAKRVTKRASTIEPAQPELMQSLNTRSIVCSDCGATNVLPYPPSLLPYPCSVCTGHLNIPSK